MKKLWANLTLPKRIGLLVFTGLAVGLGLFSLLGVRSVSESVARTLEERLTIARMMANHLDETLSYVEIQLRNGARVEGGVYTEERFSEMVASLNESLNRLGIATLRTVLLNREGRVLRMVPEESGVRWGNLLEQPTVNGSLTAGLPGISDLVSTPLAAVPVVLVSVPVSDERDEITGVLVSLIDMEQTSISSFEQAITVGETGYIEIVDSNGVVLARTRPGLPPGEFEISDHPGRFSRLIAQGTAMVGTCHVCHETSTNTNAMERRRDVLAFAPLSTVSWGVAIRQAEEEALAPASQLRERLLVLGMIVIISTAILVWLTMQGIVKPVRKLTAAAERVAAGDFETPLPVGSQDEIGKLSEAFRTMMLELARSRDELVLRNEELRTYATAIMHAQEAERQRIARELHDDVIQTLVLLCREMDNIEGAGEALPALLIEKVQEGRATAEGVIKALRDVTRALRPPILDDLGMVTSIRQLLTEYKERSKIRGQMKVVGEERRLPSDTELGIFRIAQEALRNIERHAKATKVGVTVTFDDGVVNLEVIDDGVGFPVPSVSERYKANGHLGLISMQERADLLGGQLEIHSEPCKGTHITASIAVP